MSQPSGTTSRASRGQTYFASPQRATQEDIEIAVRRLAETPLLHSAMALLGTLVCVLNEHRQILAINDAFLKSLGIDDPAGTLGMRPGEVLHCIHAKDAPNGCGTGQACLTCGAAIAIVATQETRMPQERDCDLAYERDGKRAERSFQVRTAPFAMGEQSLLLVGLRDDTDEKRRAALERTFLHDLSNMLTTLVTATELMASPDAQMHPKLISQARTTIDAIWRELRLQRLLAMENSQRRQVDLAETEPSELLGELHEILAHHPAGAGQSLVVAPYRGDRRLRTDPGLLLRALSNLVINAYEAGSSGDEVRVSAALEGEAVVFSVWNRGEIPPEVRPRIFQRFFSTKGNSGRGLGTFAVKLIVESLLGGRADFDTSATAGSTFRITLPLGTDV